MCFPPLAKWFVKQTKSEFNPLGIGSKQAILSFMKRLILLLVIPVLANCGGETPNLLALEPPSLEGPLSEGKWEQRRRDGLSFWLDGDGPTNLPEMVDFSCIENASEVRFTVIGDTDQTALWIAEDGRSSKKLLVATERGVTELEMYAGEKRLPSAAVPVDADWLKPLRSGEGRFAINAYGGRIYRLEVTEALSATIERCDLREDW